MREGLGACGAGVAGYHPRAISNRPVFQTMTTPAPETITVHKRRIACDGGGALGHPKVFLEMGTDTQVECPYCDRKFVLSREAAEAEHH
jgi:uncharacterized Zn-finger protein